MIKVNVYQGRPGNERLLKQNRWFENVNKAQNYCTYVCPKVYGPNHYFYVIVK